MKPLRTFSALLFLLACCAACQDPKNSEEYRSLVTAHASLQDSMQRMQQEVDEVTLSMNQIEKNLVKLRHDEMQIEDIRDESGPKRSQGDRIFLILAEMDAYMEENKALIGKLDKQLAKSRHVKQAILEKEAQIQELTQSMAKLREEFTTTVAAKDAIISEQEAKLTNQEKTIQEKQTTLNTGYILFGDRQNLFAKGVLQSEGGLLGKNVKLTSQLDQGLFAPVDIKKVQEIDIGVTRKQKALTIHPADSFYFVKTDGRTYLKITDPERFWSVSKYLVVVIEG
jgi:small-conductance mechanosensitive channel